jgi:serine/threonine protein kinase
LSGSPAALGWNSAAAFHSSYALGEHIGSGAFGEVRKAVHTQTGASYAVKLLPKVSQGKSALDAIQREVCTWQEAQASKFVAKLEGLFEVRAALDQLHARSFSFGVLAC